MYLEIETTHDILEEVYFMFNGKIKCAKISKVSVEQEHVLQNPYKDLDDVKYTSREKYEVSGYGYTFGSRQLFKTKSELIDSLN